MKRILTMSAVAVGVGAFGCGGGNVAVALVPEGTAGQMIGTSSGGLTDAEQTRSVKVTLAEVSVHVAGKKWANDGGERRGGKCADESCDVLQDEDDSDDERPSGKSGWQVLSGEPREVDLLAIPFEDGELLGDIALPEGKITQIRLRLQPTGSRNGQRILEGAVEEADGTRCDLFVSQSAFEPGLKLTGVFKELDVDPDKRRTLVVAFDLKDATRVQEGDGCSWRLNPTLKLHDVKD